LTSLSPASITNGTFCCCAVRLFFCIRSSDASTSARIPSTRSHPATDSRYSTWSARIGMPTTSTGACQAAGVAAAQMPMRSASTSGSVPAYVMAWR
jgi:hypothetical protein